MIKPGTVVFFTDETDDAIDRAKEFCRTRGLTPMTAKIVRREGKIMVEIKRRCKLKVGV